jgi:AcrR family transcriptional regulator
VSREPSAGTRERAPRVSATLARAHIMDAVAKLLERRRFHELTVDDVMREAGLSRTVFYRHFSGLSDVVLTLLEGLLSEVLTEAERSDPDDREVLRRTLAMAVALFRRHGRVLLAFDDAARVDAGIAASYRTLAEHTVLAISGLLERGEARGHTPPLARAEVARALAAMNGAYLLDLVARDPEFDTEAAVDALYTVWSRTTWPEAGP